MIIPGNSTEFGMPSNVCCPNIGIIYNFNLEGIVQGARKPTSAFIETTYRYIIGSLQG